MNINNFTSALIALAIPCAAMAWGQSRTVTGRVVDSDSHPLASVVVSDGYNCTATDSNGNYSMAVNDKATIITVSTPAGYLPPTGADNRPLFYQRIADGESVYDFTLIKNPVNDRHHSFMTQADVQVVSEEELCQYDSMVAEAAQFFAEIAKGCDVFGIDCGDVVSDHPELFESAMRHRAGLGFPLYIANGNHDMNYGGRSHETSVARFESVIGPTTYSFNRGDIHYIIIDNIFYIGRDYFYMGYIDERTFEWLAQDLSYVPEGSTVVITMHIPVGSAAKQEFFRYNGAQIADETVNGRHLIKMLEPYNAHIISGHQHWSRNVVYNDHCYEHNTPSACGTWWNFDICSDGTPQGYGIYTVDGSDIKWVFKCTGHDVSYQFRAYPVGTDSERPDKIIANVWNYDPQWRVEWLENGKLMGEMAPYTGKDPLAVQLFSDKSKLKYSWIMAHDNPHMFEATPSNPSAEITIRVTDRFGNVYTQQIQN